jgi:hypothetical protein
LNQEQFNKYCESCGFSVEEINNIINQTVWQLQTRITWSLWSVILTTTLI